MALRNILTQQDKTLRKVCRPVTDFGDRTAQLLDDLRETLEDANGLGLAAPQVGILRRAVIIKREDEYVELLNPVITQRSEQETGVYEGCLSCPGLRGWLMRPQTVQVHAQDRTGRWFDLECQDMPARAVCHELDHLDGILFVDLVEETITEEQLDEILQMLDSMEDEGQEEQDAPPEPAPEKEGS